MVNQYDRSALFFSVVVLVVLLVLGACGPQIHAQPVRPPRRPATAQPATPTPAVVQLVTVRPAVAPTPWRPCETNRYKSPRNCYDDRRVVQSADRVRVR